ncbi:MAG: formate dehydrogenase accessory protein FdhE [Chloroflexota bacterium]|nr:formate dehydrogenase accessory protein FdhE [Chloroflexota bacterium]MDE3193152.1 formate dehydrogenase accessory protein FdhE [Chloroflexota bacterium]
MTATAAVAGVFAERAARARELAGRYAYASEPLRLAGALFEAQASAFERAQADRPSPDELVPYIVRVGLPAVMEATMAEGTEVLREAALLAFHDGDLDGIVAAWLGGGDLRPTDRYLARAASAPILEALPNAASTMRHGESDDRHCPVCGGPPQLAIHTDTGESLVTGERRLQCSRCMTEWRFARLTCASCGDTGGANTPILSDPQRLPHVRVDACDRCRRYLLTIEMPKEPRAVAVVDEIVGLPLDLIAAERGYTKIAPNVMGF